ncbi:MAG TPA: MFS transporter, partial [Candidatus Marinimicrobia bacterium]|nr:MFS transporter [Candidatus Neomarinimicrobiota bacterium]
MLQMDFLIVIVALPKIQAELGFTPTGLSWVPNAFALVFGGLLLLGGRLGDIYGQVRIFRIGIAIFVAASLLGGIAGSPFVLIAARMLQGVGAALAGPSVL